MERNQSKLIAVTGGIGSGKSMVCRILRTLSYPVFDCDSEAKALMDADTEIHRRLIGEIDASVVCDGIIDRRRLADIVFADSAKLETLNSIVHGAVRSRLALWAASQPSAVAFVETAILFQSGLNEDVDAEWRVEAPREIRIARVMSRNSLPRTAVEARIDAQAYTPEATAVRPPLTIIDNSGITPILPQIEASLDSLQFSQQHTTSSRSPRPSVMP